MRQRIGVTHRGYATAEVKLILIPSAPCGPASIWILHASSGENRTLESHTFAVAIPTRHHTNAAASIRDLAGCACRAAPGAPAARTRGRPPRVLSQRVLRAGTTAGWPCPAAAQARVRRPAPSSLPAQPGVGAPPAAPGASGAGGTGAHGEQRPPRRAVRAGRCAGHAAASSAAVARAAIPVAALPARAGLGPSALSVSLTRPSEVRALVSGVDKNLVSNPYK